MSQAELAAPRLAPTLGVERVLSGWGRTAPSRCRVLRPRSIEEVAEAMAATARLPRGLIARGAGRSYGDAAQNSGGTVLDATALRWIVGPDAERGVVRVGAGTSFAELLLALAARGMTLPVVPGTRHLTVGGALAADVHGKNHPRDGSLGGHLESFTLCTPAHGPTQVSREQEQELFDVTLGAMGLTGTVVEATLRVVPMRSPTALADIDRAADIEHALSLMSRSSGYRYSIAWLDLLAEGPAFGRAVLTRSEEGPAVEQESLASTAGRHRAPLSPNSRLSVPRRVPSGLLRPATVRAFNALHWHAAPRRARGQVLSMSAQLFPLDALGEWNRLYGWGGLLQYQFAVPLGAEETLLRVLHELRARRQPMYLAVLKRFGAGGGGPLSFPLPGWTVAIDLPALAPGLREALDAADELLAGVGGRVYLAKDARLRPELLPVMYPQLARLAALREHVDPQGVLRSDMARRLGLSE